MIRSPPVTRSRARRQSMSANEEQLSPNTARRCDFESLTGEADEHTDDNAELSPGAVAAAREVLALPAVSDELRKFMALDDFESEWERYMTWLRDRETQQGESPVVFAHNDAQYGNLLRLNNLAAGALPHHQVRSLTSYKFSC